MAVSEERTPNNPKSSKRVGGLPCSKCYYVGTSKQDLKNHNASEHKKPRPECDQCGFSAKNMKLLKSHIKTQHFLINKITVSNKKRKLGSFFDILVLYIININLPNILLNTH